MQYRRLGGSGLKVSAVGFGTLTFGDPKLRSWFMDRDAAEPFFRKAFDLGITFVDTADMYSTGVSETIVGHWLKRMDMRREVVLATKVFAPMSDEPNDRGLSRRHILDAIDRSLERLQTDHVDLYQIHRWDPETPIEETMEALNDVVRAGKARYIGASSMWAWQFAKAQQVARDNGWTRFVSMQNHYNLVYREEEREMQPLCVDQGVGLIPWSPIGRGYLAGKASGGTGRQTARGTDDKNIDAWYGREGDAEIAARVIEIAEAHEVAPATIALAWLLTRPGVTSPIFGSTRIEHIEAAAKAVEVRLTEEQITRLEEPYRPHAIAGHS